MPQSTTTNPMKEQIKTIKQIFLVDETAHTFSKSFQLLFRLVKESLILIWLSLCWGIVAITWMLDRGKATRYQVEQLYEKICTFSQNRTKKEVIVDATQTLSNKSQNTLKTMVIKAKKQVGLQDS